MYAFVPLLRHKEYVTQGQYSKLNITGLNSEFSFSKIGCLTQSDQLFTYSLAWRTDGFMLFQRALTQNASSKIWTWVTVSISYDDNHYTKRASKQWNVNINNNNDDNNILIVFRAVFLEKQTLNPWF